MKGMFSIEAEMYERRILREIVLLKRLKHPYIVELIDIIEPVNRETFEEIYLVLELADTDLKKIIESELNLTMEEVRNLTYKLLCCLNYLHSAKIIHRDLKPENILITNTINLETKEKNPVLEWKIKICDFGLARSMVGVESD
jgi:mitogen-activated protein kinase 1/3